MLNTGHWLFWRVIKVAIDDKTLLTCATRQIAFPKIGSSCPDKPLIDSERQAGMF